MARFTPVRVRGSSMHPTLHDGDLLAIRALRAGEPVAGLVVCVRTPDRELIKRVTQVAGDTIWIEGDNKEVSTDSRTLGSFPVEQVAGVAAFVYWPPRRIGRVR